MDSDSDVILYINIFEQTKFNIKKYDSSFRNIK